MLACKKDVQQNSKRIHIGCRSDGASSHLLRCGICRSERRALFSRQLCRSTFMPFPFEQLGDAKIQKLYLSPLSNKHVRRFYVAMDDQVGVCMRHSTEHIEEERHSRIDI